MKKLELIKGLSYSTMLFTAKKGASFIAENDLAERLLQTGKFKLIEEIPEEKVIIAAKNLDDMKKDELISYASEHGIDVAACKTNEDRISVIRAAENSAGSDTTATPGFEE